MTVGQFEVGGQLGAMVLQSASLREARLDYEPGAKLSFGQLDPGVAECLCQDDGGHESRQGAIDVGLLLEGREVTGRRRRDQVEPSPQFVEGEDPALDVTLFEEHFDHVPELDADELRLPFHEGGLRQLGQQTIAKRAHGLGRVCGRHEERFGTRRDIPD